MHLHPPGGKKKFFRRNLQGKFVSAPPRTRSAPPARAEVNFWTVFAGRVRFGGVFRRFLRATTKKWSSAFLVRKSARPDKILATPMVRFRFALAYRLVKYSIRQTFNAVLTFDSGTSPITTMSGYVTTVKTDGSDFWQPGESMVGDTPNGNSTYRVTGVYVGDTEQEKEIQRVIIIIVNHSVF